MPSSPSTVESWRETPRFCSTCGRSVIVTDASFCKECGAPLVTGSWLRSDLGWNPLVALGLSLVPGLGQLYKGQRWPAAGWFLLVAGAYVAQPLGYLLHAVCALNAALAGAIEPALLARSTPKRLNPER